jgi:hypothetical protein
MPANNSEQAGAQAGNVIAQSSVEGSIPAPVTIHDINAVVDKARACAVSPGCKIVKQRPVLKAPPWANREDGENIFGETDVSEWGGKQLP